MRSLLLTLLLAGSLSAPALSQEVDWPEAAPEDVETLDGIMRAYYEVVSGAEGDPAEWERDKSLHIPEALVVITSARGDSVVFRPISISDWHANSGPVRARSFYEYEISREVRQHGSTVHVWSTYEWKSAPDGPVGGRGINSIEMVWDGSRYWITSWSFDGRGTPVPLEYMPQDIPGAWNGDR
ncbi:MAG: hypothetical protein HKN29_00160 [Rhodothermales bacterium]|nr:hypothetical protein [Rhodothermales bacterium]